MPYAMVTVVVVVVTTVATVVVCAHVRGQYITWESPRWQILTRATIGEGVFDSTKKRAHRCFGRPKTLVVRLYLGKRDVKQYE